MIWVMTMCGNHLIVDFQCQHVRNLYVTSVTVSY